MGNRVAKILSDAANTHALRSELYGDNYKHFGSVMRGLFPEGLMVQTEDEWNRLGIVVQCASKLGRYCNSIAQGDRPHVDSAHDLSVYAAMLQELSEQDDEEKFL